MKRNTHQIPTNNIDVYNSQRLQFRESTDLLPAKYNTLASALLRSASLPGVRCWCVSLVLDTSKLINFILIMLHFLLDKHVHIFFRIHCHCHYSLTMLIRPTFEPDVRTLTPFYLETLTLTEKYCPA